LFKEDRQAKNLIVNTRFWVFLRRQPVIAAAEMAKPEFEITQ